MLINVFGNSSSSNDNNKIDTSRFVQKSYLKSNYIETDIDHDINLKNQYRIINLQNPINNKDAINKIYIDTKIADVIKRNIQNNEYISFLDNDNVEYKLVKYRPKTELTTISFFNLGTGSNINSLWGYYTYSIWYSNTGNIRKRYNNFPVVADGAGHFIRGIIIFIIQFLFFNW